MTNLIGAIWVAAGAASAAGTLWLVVASKLGLWPLRTNRLSGWQYHINGDLPAETASWLPEGEYWITTSAGTVHGRGTPQQAARLRKELEGENAG